MNPYLDPRIKYTIVFDRVNLDPVERVKASVAVEKAKVALLAIQVDGPPMAADPVEKMKSPKAGTPTRRKRHHSQ